MSRRLGLEVAAIALVLIACTAGLSERPSPPATASLSLSPAPTAAVSSTPAGDATPTPVPSTGAPAVTPAPTASSTTPPAPVASLPVSGSMDEIESVLIAPGLKGFLYVAISRPPGGGSILVLLDPDGTPYPGWPIVVGESNNCRLFLRVADGSVRFACTDYVDLTLWVFAFDASGRSMAGWPINLGRVGLDAGRMIDEKLTILTGAANEVWITSIGVDGVPHPGVRVAIDASLGGGDWAIGPDGVAYGTFQTPFDESIAAERAKAKSALFAVGPGGIAAGFPVSIAGWASRPAFDGAGRVHLVVGSPFEPPTRMLVFDTAGQTATGASGVLDVAAPADAESAGPSGHHAPPLVGADATRFVVAGFNDTTVLAIGPSGQPLAAGWPYRSDLRLQQNFICPPRAACDGTTYAAPAIGPGNVLYLLQSGRFGPTGLSGGSIVAIGPDGRVRTGWPRTLKRAGSGFWMVVVGSDGTAFALAVEQESIGYSATVLAIAPDSTVRYATTIVEP